MCKHGKGTASSRDDGFELFDPKAALTAGFLAITITLVGRNFSSRCFVLAAWLASLLGIAHN